MTSASDEGPFQDLSSWKKEAINDLKGRKRLKRDFRWVGEDPDLRANQNNAASPHSTKNSSNLLLAWHLHWFRHTEQWWTMHESWHFFTRSIPKVDMLYIMLRMLYNNPMRSKDIQYSKRMQRDDKSIQVHILYFAVDMPGLRYRGLIARPLPGAILMHRGAKEFTWTTRCW